MRKENRGASKGAIGSYKKYQQDRIKKEYFSILGCIGLIFLAGLVLTGKFPTDFIKIATKSQKTIQPVQESVYLSQPEINYTAYAKPTVAKGIYIPVKKIENYEDYIMMAKETGVNSFVIDFKDDTGYLTFPSDNQKLIDKGMVRDNPPISNVEQMMARLCEENIYPIARIVAFKDNVVPKLQPELAVHSLDGTTYTTSGGDTWLDPYNKANWAYLLEVSKEAMRLGFKEVQFDYVRFHESMNEERIIMNSALSKSEIITEFIQYICENLQDEGLKVSADVFGAVILSDIDAEIVGQDFVEMSKYLDYICPMVYPSHYAEGTFGIEYPNLDPYQIIYKTMRYGLNKMENVEGEIKATIRPWLQDFSLKNLEPYLEYGEDEIRKQIQGANDAGIEEWLFWNAAGNYTKEGFR